MTYAVIVLQRFFLVSGQAQNRFDYGKFQDFSKSPTEHIIMEIDHPIQLRNVKGLTMDEEESPLRDAVFELREKSSDTVRMTTTDARGHCKATMNGFPSVVGVVVVPRSADRKAIVQIRMKVGV